VWLYLSLHVAPIPWSTSNPVPYTHRAATTLCSTVHRARVLRAWLRAVQDPSRRTVDGPSHPGRRRLRQRHALQEVWTRRCCEQFAYAVATRPARSASGTPCTCEWRHGRARRVEFAFSVRTQLRGRTQAWSECWHESDSPWRGLRNHHRTFQRQGRATRGRALVWDRLRTRASG